MKKVSLKFITNILTITVLTLICGTYIMNEHNFAYAGEETKQLEILENENTFTVLDKNTNIVTVVTTKQYALPNDTDLSLRTDSSLNTLLALANIAAGEKLKLEQEAAAAEEAARKEKELAQQEENKMTEGSELNANATNISYASEEIISPYEGYITEFMDLTCRVNITTEQINSIIEHWLSINSQNSDSEFRGLGQAFIDASKASGLDPLFLLGLAATESGWHVSDLHSRKNNPYSINMIDADVEQGYVMGDNLYEGIINGAVWIKEKYYDKGQTCIYSMIHGDKMYASSEDTWIRSIVDIMDKSYRMLT